MTTADASDGTATQVLAHTALTTENRSIEIDGVTLAYRRFGDAEGDASPLLCLQHFRGNLDGCDPALVDRLAGDCEVILLDNRGVGASTGVVPDNVEDMARDVLRFVDALRLRQVDLLGFSLGVTSPGSERRRWRADGLLVSGERKRPAARLRTAPSVESHIESSSLNVAGWEPASVLDTDQGVYGRDAEARQPTSAVTTRVSSERRSL